MGPISAFPMAPSTPAIAISAAGDAARELKRGKSSSGRAFATSRADEERLKRRSNRLAQEFQGAMEKSVKRKLNSMSGSQNNRKLGLKVAQFIPGKGLEVAGAQVENDPSIYCSLGIKGEKHVDPLDETFSRIKGRQVSMDFAFKLINDNSKLLDHDKETRVTAMNCFRHVNPESFDYVRTGWTKDISASTAFVRSITVTAPGEYSSTSGVPVVTCSLPGGTWATPILVSSTTPGVYEVSAVEITIAGTGYTTQPAVTFHVGTNTSELVAATAQANLLFIDDDKGDANVKWHSTLGPDASLIRVGTHGKTSSNQVVAGTWRGPATTSGHIFGTLDIDTAAAANTLISPYRYPRDMEVMYSRVNRQLLENYGWMLNPFKFTSFSRNASSEGITSDGTPQRTTVELWSNPDSVSLDFNSVSNQSNKKWSYPANVNNRIGTNVTDPKGFEWHSQFGPGKLAYQFSNDGTNPVCIDICVVGIKKDSPVPVELLQNICNYNYAINKFANIGDTNLNGFQCTNQSTSSTLPDLDLGSEEWHKNAKLPFMPDACFKNPQSYLDAIPDSMKPTSYHALQLYDQLEQGKKNPFKVVKRDQFIVSSGSSRAWNTTLPSIKYRPELYEDVSYPPPSDDQNRAEENAVTADEYTFVLCIGASGMPKPVEEVYTANKPFNNDGAEAIGSVDMKTIIDRQPSTCNVSVVGTYKETIYPSFPKDVSSVNFINGRLTEPYFETSPGNLVPNPHVPLAPRVNTVDISQLGQVVHVTDTGVIGVGALNTDVGA